MCHSFLRLTFNTSHLSLLTFSLPDWAYSPGSLSHLFTSAHLHVSQVSEAVSCVDMISVCCPHASHSQGWWRQHFLTEIGAQPTNMWKVILESRRGALLELILIFFFSRGRETKLLIHFICWSCWQWKYLLWSHCDYFFLAIGW